MSTRKFYVHSAIPYVNAAPHIGHAQEFVYADTIGRYQKLLGKEVSYLCGADENALKIVQAAEKANMNTQDFCDKHQQEFLDVANKLNVHFTYWQRGSDTTHHFPSAQLLWNLCKKNGDIYRKSYEGLYCVGCESFYTADELTPTGECIEHPGKKLELVSEDNYFFRLSKYQQFFETLYANDEIKIFPNFRKNETMGFIKKGLEDFSISRSVKRAKNWGVPVPDDPSQIMYVWFDALNIYHSGIGFGWDQKLFKQLAPADLMVIGKGILRFHAIYWPAILQSAGLSLPKTLFVHGYLTVEGQKMSKTVGNVVDPNGVIERFGTDAVRYYLTREIPSYADGDYSEKRFTELYNADLANGLGNLVARVAKLALSLELDTQEKSFSDLAPADYRNAMDECRFNDALAIVWDKIKSIDQYLNIKKPWNLTGEALAEVLSYAITEIIEIATLLQPFMPDSAQKILTHFKGQMLTPLPPLFPRRT